MNGALLPMADAQFDVAGTPHCDQVSICRVDDVWLEMWFLQPLGCFLRSVMLLQLLAFLRLLCLPLRLEAGRGFRNSIVRRVRFGLYGAPLPLCTALVVCCQQGAVAAGRPLKSGDRRGLAAPLQGGHRRQFASAEGLGGGRGLRARVMWRCLAFLWAGFWGVGGWPGPARWQEVTLGVGLLPFGPILADAALVPDCASEWDDDDDVGDRVDVGPDAAAESLSAPGTAQELASHTFAEEPGGQVWPAGAAVSDDDWSDSEPSPRPDWSFCAVVLRFQRTMICCSCRADWHAEVDALQAFVARQCLRGPDEGQLLVVAPQPSATCAVFMLVEPWQARVHKVPVCLQVYVRGGRPCFFMCFLDETARADDLIQCCGDLHVSGMRFFLDADLRELDGDDSFRPRAGMFIQALPSTVPPRPYPSLQERLRDVAFFYADVEVEGWPEEPCLSMSAGLVEFRGSSFYVPRLLGFELAEQVAQVTRQHEGRFSVVAARHMVADFALGNRPVNGVFGVVPSGTRARVPVFVDPRSLAQQVKVVLHLPGPLPVADFLRNVGVILPVGFPIRVSVDQTSSLLDGEVLIRAGSVYVVSVATQAVEACSDDDGDEASATADRDGNPRDDGVRHGSSGGLSDWSRRVCARRASSSGGASCGGQRHDAWECFPDVWRKLDGPLVDSWARLRPEQCAIQRAVRVASLLRLQVQLVETECQMRLPLVYSELEALPPAVGAPGTPGSSGTRSPSSSDGPELKRVRVRIVYFQGPDRWDFLWTQQGEDIDSLLIRGEIVLNDDPQGSVLLPVWPQPDVGAIVLLSAPKWWSLVPRFPCFVQLDDPTRASFMQVVAATAVVEDVLHEDLFSDGQARSVYVAPEVLETGPAALEAPGGIRWRAGALLRVVRPDGDAPDFQATQQVLDALPHCLPGAVAALSSFGEHPYDAVLLGPGFSQVTLRVQPDRALQQCAVRLQVAEEDLYLHQQPTPFPWLWIAGKPVSLVYGWRLKRQMGHRAGVGLFVDSRALGAPACYVHVSRHSLSVDELLEIVGVQPPPGFAAVWSFCADMRRAPDRVEVRHGDLVCVWLVPDASEEAAEGSPEEADGSCSERDGTR